MTLAELSRRRMANERLTGAPFSAPEEVVSWMGAVQAQDFAGAKWGLAQRCVPGVTSAGIDALCDEGKILRTHVLRPTWHFVAPADLRWLLKLTAPRVNRLLAYMDPRLELDAAVLRRSRALLKKTLAGGVCLTREELGTVYEKARIVASGQRLAHLVMHAELDGLICSGPLKGKQFTYGWLEDRVPVAKPLGREESLTELTRRFFTSHGPAEVRDFAWWSGLTLTEAREGLELAKAHLVRETVEGWSYWLAPAPATPPRASSSKPVVHLLPNYDEFMIAYRDNPASLDPAMRKQLRINSEALTANVIALNGRVIGGWRRTVGRRAAVITTVLLAQISKRENAALDDAVARYGRFLEVPVSRESV